MNFRVIFILLTILSLYSCRISKKINKAISSTPPSVKTSQDSPGVDSFKLMQDQLTLIKSTFLKPTTFSAKIKVESSGDNGKNPDITANIRMIRDSAIWMSMTATILGVEIYRALITPDSITILDKQEKNYIKRSISYLQDIIQLPINFSTLQDLLLGNPIFLGDSIHSYRTTQTQMMIATINPYFKNLLTIRTPNHWLEHIKLDDMNMFRNRTANISYGKYENNTGYTFSTDREISLAEKNKIDIKLAFKQYEFNKELSVNFQIPKNYKSK